MRAVIVDRKEAACEVPAAEVVAASAIAKETVMHPRAMEFLRTDLLELFDIARGPESGGDLQADIAQPAHSSSTTEAGAPSLLSQ